jgi:hypothetical protein
MLDFNGAPVGQKGESCRVFFLFLAYSLTKCVLADTLLADTDDHKEEDIDDKEEEDIDDKEEDVRDKEEDVYDNKKGTSMPSTTCFQAKTGGCYATKNDHQKRAWSGETCHLCLQEVEDQHTGVQALLNEDA